MDISPVVGDFLNILPFDRKGFIVKIRTEIDCPFHGF